MAKRKQYPLRIDPALWEAVERWAADDLRSVNAQVEFILRRALKDAGRLRPSRPEGTDAGGPAAGLADDPGAEPAGDGKR